MNIRRPLYLNRLIAAKHDGLIKVVTGIRRCGKSYLLNTLFRRHLRDSGVERDQIIILALDDATNSELLDPKKLTEFIKGKIIDQRQYYCILDEIQLVENFEQALNGLLRINNLDIYVTGSNSKFLSSDIITEFRGRGEEIRVYPLSFAEFMSVYPGDKMSGWEEYCTYGGLPLVTTMDTAERKTNYLAMQQNNAYINDVVERNNIRNDGDLKRLVETLASSVGSLSNPTKLSNTFRSATGIDVDLKTISLYLKYLEDAFLIEKAQRYDVKGKKYLSTPYKYYFTDLGVRNAFINFRQPNDSHVMENAIYLELRRRGFAVDVGTVRVRTTKNNEYINQQYEVDFIANKGSNRIYIQSAYSIPDEAKREQEERSLIATNDAFKKFIIVKDLSLPYRDENGVIFMNIYDFLLQIDSLEF